MANEIFKDELLSDDELDNITGGTSEETIDMINAIGCVRERTNYCDGRKFYTLLPPDEVAGYLKKTFNIDATINLGRFNDDVHQYEMGGKPNEYSINGKSLTQKQVLDIIKIVNGK
ncbi:MAG: hypothetical protein IKN27_12575 [Selenomonadaceae bacterium]|nr:hypothetical protein [Selenomonadaceae bacterium]